MEVTVPINYFFFNVAATTEIYTLSLHDALPICVRDQLGLLGGVPLERADRRGRGRLAQAAHRDRKSTRLNSSHVSISYAVFCLKKKKAGHHRHQQAPPGRHLGPDEAAVRPGDRH